MPCQSCHKRYVLLTRHAVSLQPALFLSGDRNFGRKRVIKPVAICLRYQYNILKIGGGLFTCGRKSYRWERSFCWGRLWTPTQPNWAARFLSWALPSTAAPPWETTTTAC